jgi:fumarylacetoacetate (FAA) hydrolase family protein
MRVPAPFTPISIPRLGTLLFLGHAFLTTCNVARRQGHAPVRNGDVSNVVGRKLGDNVMLAKSKCSPWKFGTSMDTLLMLKPAAVSNAV